MKISKACLGLLLFGAGLSLAPARSEPYLRIGLGADKPAPANFLDRQCKQQKPPALFGCGKGNNGAKLNADGAFASGAVIDAALGYRFNEWLRAEALLSYRPSSDYGGEANFLNAGASQPVSANLSSIAGFAVGYLDLPKIGKIQPFLGSGVGSARNRISSVRYDFPKLGSSAKTTIVGGTSHGFAWLLTAGVAIPLSPQLNLDIAYRFTDLGRVLTDDGMASIERQMGRSSLEIAGTESHLQTNGVIATLRYHFR
ncbi:MAG: outer membrane protein [Prochlorococcus sp.]